jgi:DNA (cytosine-5)-methyltransferase 1
LKNRQRFVTMDQIARALGRPLDAPTFERHITNLSRDFHIETRQRKDGVLAYRLGEFKAFVGQADHARHIFFQESLSQIS